MFTKKPRKGKHTFSIRNNRNKVIQLKKDIEGPIKCHGWKGSHLQGDVQEMIPSVRQQSKCERV